MSRNQLILGLILSTATLATILPVVVIGGFIAYSINRDEVAEPIARQKVHEVKKEFRQIPILSGATATSNDGFTFDPQHVTEGRLYRTNLPYSEIRAHYDDELSKLGRQFDVELDVKGADGRNHGGKQVFYSKDQFTAFLHHVGTKLNMDTRIIFALAGTTNYPAPNVLRISVGR